MCGEDITYKPGNYIANLGPHSKVFEDGNRRGEREELDKVKGR